MRTDEDKAYPFPSLVDRMLYAADGNWDTMLAGLPHLARPNLEHPNDADAVQDAPARSETRR
jgi:hypothetical protein